MTMQRQEHDNKTKHLEPFGDLDSFEGLHQIDVIVQNRRAHKHGGNCRYQEIVQNHREAYVNARRKEDKSSITRCVIQKVKEIGSRFMKYHKPTKTWVELDTTSVHEKVSHALRNTNLDRRNRRPIFPGSTAAAATSAAAVAESTLPTIVAPSSPTTVPPPTSQPERQSSSHRQLLWQQQSKFEKSLSDREKEDRQAKGIKRFSHEKLKSSSIKTTKKMKKVEESATNVGTDTAAAIRGIHEFARQAWNSLSFNSKSSSDRSSPSTRNSSSSALPETLEPLMTKTSQRLQPQQQQNKREHHGMLERPLDMLRSLSGGLVSDFVLSWSNTPTDVSINSKNLSDHSSPSTRNNSSSALPDTLEPLVTETSQRLQPQQQPQNKREHHGMLERPLDMLRSFSGGLGDFFHSWSNTSTDAILETFRNTSIGTTASGAKSPVEPEAAVPTEPSVRVVTSEIVQEKEEDCDKNKSNNKHQEDQALQDLQSVLASWDATTSAANRAANHGKHSGAMKKFLESWNSAASWNVGLDEDQEEEEGDKNDVNDIINKDLEPRGFQDGKPLTHQVDTQLVRTASLLPPRRSFEPFRSMSDAVWNDFVDAWGEASVQQSTATVHPTAESSDGDEGPPGDVLKRPQSLGSSDPRSGFPASPKKRPLDIFQRFGADQKNDFLQSWLKMGEKYLGGGNTHPSTDGNKRRRIDSSSLET